MADFPPMTDKAAEAFADYVELGPKRSLEALARLYRTSTKPAPTKHLRTLKDWSAKFQWQARIADAITEAVTRRLEQAAELDADTFFKTSVLMNSTIDRAMAGKILIDPIESIKIRETVRKPVAKGATNVNVKLDVQISQLIERIAETEGLNDVERAEFQKDVEKYLAEVNS